MTKITKASQSRTDNTHPMSILLVEDEPSHIEAIRRAFHTADPNIKIRVVSTLKEYRKTITSALPDIVLMDMKLPDGRAFDVITYPPEANSFPIVVMTSYGNEEIAVEAMKSGALDYVVKSPEVFTNIPRTIERALREWKLLHDHKLSAEELKKSQLLLKSSIESPKDLIILSIDNHYQYLNFNTYHKEVMVNAYGKDIKLGMNLLECITNDDDKRKAKINYDRALKGESHITIEEYGNLERYSYETRYNPIINDKNEIIGATAFSTNITERKRAEEALRDSEQRLRFHVENSPMAVIEWDKNFIVTRWSGESEKIFGWSAAEVFGKPIMDLNMIFEEDIHIVQKTMKRLSDETTKYVISSNRNYTKDGQVIHCEWYNSVLSDQYGKMVSVMSQVLDITERKQAEEALQESVNHFRALFENANDGIIYLSTKTEIVEMNSAFAKMHGYSIAEMKKMKLQDLDVEDISVLAPERMKRIANGEDLQFEVKHFHKDGHIIVLEVTTCIMRLKREDLVVAFHRDITERKRTEEELIKSEEKYRSIFENVQDIYYETSFDGTILEVSPSIEFMSKGQYRRTELLGKSMYDLYNDVNDRHAIIATLQKTHSVNDYEVHLKNKDGSLIHCSISAKIRFNFKGQPEKIIGSMHDITERKLVEEALLDKERYQRALLDNFPFAVWLKDTESRFLAVNQLFAKTFNIPTADELVGKTDFDIAERSIAEDYIAHDRVVMESRQKSSIEQEIIGLEKGKWYETYKAPVIGKNDELLGTVGFLRDITERKRTEAMLENERIMLRTLVDTLPYKIYIKDTESRFIICNKASAIRLGVSNPEEVIGKSDFDFLPTELATRFRADEQEVIKSGKSLIDHEEPIDQISGTTRWNLVTKVPIRDKQGNIIGIVGSGRDITEQKQVERTLRENEEFFRLLFTTSPDAIILFDPFSNIVPWEIIDCNEVACRMNGYTREELIGKSVEMVNAKMTTPEEHEEYIKMLQNKGVAHYETLHRHRDGHSFPVEVATSLVTLGGRQLVLGIDRDITERKRTEKELQETTEFLENLFSFANAPIMVWDNNLRITKFNLAFERLTEYTMYDVLGKNPEMLVPADDRAFVRSLLARALDGENLLSIEFPVQSKNAEIRIVLWNTANIYDADGKAIIATIAHGQDITERKRAEEMQRESETRYRSVLQSATDAIVTADHKGMIVGWNSGAERIFGYSYTEAVGLSLTSLMPILHRARHTNGMERVLSGGNRHVIGKTVELEGIRKDESVFPLELSLSTWETKSGIFFSGIIRDITERKQAAEELLKLTSAVEQSDSSIVITNLKGDIEYVNPKFLGITGYSSQEIIGKNPRVLKSGHTSDEEYKNMWNTIANGQVWRGEFQNKKKNGELYWESAAISPVRNSSGKISHFIAVKEDITQQRVMADQLRQMQKLEGIGTLAGGIAHDFNNILGIILAYITSIKRFKDDAKKLDLSIDIIMKAVHRGTTLVQQILTFARKTETKFTAVDVNDVVMEIMSMILETFPKILTYTQKFEKGIPFINADRLQLYQALLNLCVNARDAMPKGGVLNIDTSMVSVASLRNQHPDASASSYICIEVSDTGEGMSEEIRKRIFEPFFTTKGIGKGTGMGLAVVFGVAQTHKGFIDVESQLGKGTTFRLYLPSSPVEEPISEKVEETLEEISGGTETLLIVEDEEMLRASLELVLEEKGYTVLSAGDGLAALKIYREKKNDIALVLTDLGLPNMTGMEECVQIRKINSSARIIVATGFLDPEMKSEFLKARIQHFLYKPYDLNKVLKMVREVLDEK